MRERVADVIVPITGGRLDMLAKATARCTGRLRCRHTSGAWAGTG